VSSGASSSAGPDGCKAREGCRALRQLDLVCPYIVLVQALPGLLETLAMSKRKTDDDWAALRFEIRQVFTPSTAVSTADLFAGRQKQIRDLLDAISERGRHAVIFGEPGVGKTSLAQIIRLIIPKKTSRIAHIRKQSFSSDTFSSLWKEVFREMTFMAGLGDGRREYPVSEIYENGISPNDVVRELSMFSENDIPIIVFDEYNRIEDRSVSGSMAETIKAVSDIGINVTIVIVGIGDNVEELVDGHESIIRCSEEILMPRMEKSEMRELLEKRFMKLRMEIDGDAKWKIINLSKGLPAFGHQLGQSAALYSVESRRTKVLEADVDLAIEDLLNSSQNPLKRDYETATHSNQRKARYKQILTACALAHADESGYFVPKHVEEPLQYIFKRKIKVDGFNNNLKEFTDPKRGRILQRIGSERLYRYRFRNPAMQPYVIMKGIAEGFLGEEAKLALSSPEQPDLFCTVYQSPS
jgi:Cdc6-like AAA superfamily ATPase